MTIKNDVMFGLAFLAPVAVMVFIFIAEDSHRPMTMPTSDAHAQYTHGFALGAREELQRQRELDRAMCVEWIAVLRPSDMPRQCRGGHIEFTPSNEGIVACCRCERGGP